MSFIRNLFEGNMKLHVIHVAAFRRIDSRMDTLLRRETSKGVMEDKDILSFFLFHLLETKLLLLFLK